MIFLLFSTLLQHHRDVNLFDKQNKSRISHSFAPWVCSLFSSWAATCLILIMLCIFTEWEKCLYKICYWLGKTWIKWMGLVSFEDKQIKTTNCNQRKETLLFLVRPWFGCQLIIPSCTAKTSGNIIQGWAACSPDREWLNQVEGKGVRRLGEAESMAVGQMLKIFLKAEALRSSLDADEHPLAVEQHKSWKYFRDAPV